MLRRGMKEPFSENLIADYAEGREHSQSSGAQVGYVDPTSLQPRSIRIAVGRLLAFLHPCAQHTLQHNPNDNVSRCGHGSRHRESGHRTADMSENLCRQAERSVNHICTNMAVSSTSPKRRSVDRSFGQSVSRSIDRLIESVDRSIGRSVGRSEDRSRGRPVGQPTNRAVGLVCRSVDRSINRSFGRVIRSLRSIERSIARAVDGAVDRSSDRSVGQSLDRSFGRFLGSWMSVSVDRSID